MEYPEAGRRTVGGMRRVSRNSGRCDCNDIEKEKEREREREREREERS